MDRHFAWMLGPPGRAAGGLRLAPGGVDAPAVIEVVRDMAARLRAGFGPGSWMMVVRGEVVGLCSYKHAPGSDGVVEIGYGVAASRQRQGHATTAVAALLDLAARDRRVRGLSAETVADNHASRRVLERNGFQHVGQRTDPDDGTLDLWRRMLV